LTRRIAISLAAALVKVRHSSRLGGVPWSSRLSTRSVSTLVLPVPAEALTQTLSAGLAAACCRRLAASIASRALNKVALMRHRPRPTTP